MNKIKVMKKKGKPAGKDSTDNVASNGMPPGAMAAPGPANPVPKAIKKANYAASAMMAGKS